MVWSPAPFLMECDREEGRRDALAGRDPQPNAWSTYMDGYREGERDREAREGVMPHDDSGL